jgi:hypothetical protein
MGEHAGFRAGTHESGKHRTEVTEVTEGDWGGRRIDWVALVASVREHTNRESIAQWSRRSQRGIGVGRQIRLGGTGGFRAGTHESGKHRTEVTEVTEGDWGDWVNIEASGREAAHAERCREENTSC